MMDGYIPHRAEHHSIGDWLRPATRRKSALIPDAELMPERQFFCRGCGVSKSEPEHGKTDGCLQCGLMWQALGAVLYVWRAE